MLGDKNNRTESRENMFQVTGNCQGASSEIEREAIKYYYTTL